MKRTKITFLLTGVLGTLLAAGSSRAQTLTTVASFNGTNGSTPLAGLTVSADGSTLYGTTYGGAQYGLGTVFSIPTTGGTPTVLASAASAGYGGEARGALTLSGSTLYGTTAGGGSGGYGTVFSLPVAGGTVTQLASFDSTNGANPFAGVTLSGSTLYGTEPNGGAPGAGAGEGSVYSVPTTGGGPNTLYNFTNGPLSEGAAPFGGLTLSHDGSTLYGTTFFGGYQAAGGGGWGEIFSMPVGGGAPTVLTDFPPPAVVTNPVCNLTLSADGSTLYAIAGGTIFSESVTGGAPTVLAELANSGNPNLELGAQTGGLLLVGSTLYGTTTGGGAFGDGQVFSVPVTGGTPHILATFNGTNGADPTGGLVLVGSTLYGTTAYGGLRYSGQTYTGDGTIFAINLVPEPSSLILAGFGAAALLAMAARRNLRRATGGQG